MPAVSVVIPCYRQGHLLGDALGSLVAQTVGDWEAIVVGPVDETGPALVRFLAQAKVNECPKTVRIALLDERERKGPGSARNLGVRKSRGRYVLPLDADDMIGSAFLERTVAVLEHEPDVAIVYTDQQCFGVHRGRWETGPFTRDALLECNRLPYCSLYRREVWDIVGGYSDEHYEDWSFWLGAATLGYKAKRIPEALFLYRTTTGTTRSSAVRGREYQFAQRVRDRWREPGP